MNKKNNFMNNKKNNRNNNNHQGFQGGRGGGNHIHRNNRVLNHWTNERILMQRICDGAIVTLLSNAIAAATPSNTSKNTSISPLQISTVCTPPQVNDEASLQSDRDGTKQESSSSPSQKIVQENKEDKKTEEKEPSTSNTCQTLQLSSMVKKKSQEINPRPQNNNTGFENPLLQTFLASILNNQLINNNGNRRNDKGTQTIERILTPSPHLIRAAAVNSVSAPGFQQQQLINNTFLTSNYKFHGLAKTSSVYFTRGIR
jgi:hypothetical protein